MRLLFDQNVSPYLVNSLSDVYPDSNHVKNIGLDCSLDIDIINYAKEKDYIIITKDIDFPELSVLHDPPPKIVWLRIGNCTTHEIESVLRKHVGDIEKLNKGELPPVLILV